MSERRSSVSKKTDSINGDHLLKTLLIVAGAIILVPLSVDNNLSIELSSYTLRINYIGTLIALLMICFDLAFFRSVSIQQTITHFLKAPYWKAFGIMAVAGCVGLSYSENLKRSIVFLIWTMGTLISLPVIVRYYSFQFGNWPHRLASVYLVAQSAIIWIDSLLCRFDRLGPKLGKVYTISGSCRPHAFYQEPNYFSGFALLGLIWIRLQISKEESKRWRRFFYFTYLFVASAILLSTSKMGWVAVAGITGIETISLLAKTLQRRFEVRSSTLFGVFLAACLSLVALNKGLITRGWEKAKSNPSLHLRLYNVDAAISVFQESPWVGVGPGASGAYAANRLPNLPYIADRFPHEAEKSQLRRDPLSYNLFTELLTEWGIIGSLSFLLGLFFLFRKFPLEQASSFGWVLLLIYLTGQTLPRFDLWIALSLIATLVLMQPSRQNPIRESSDVA